MVGWLVGEQVFSKTALRIFMIFCMNVPYHKGKKRTRPFVRENSRSLIIHENVFWSYFGHFLEIGCPDTSDVVYSDRYH